MASSRRAADLSFRGMSAESRWGRCPGCDGGPMRGVSLSLGGFRTSPLPSLALTPAANGPLSRRSAVCSHLSPGLIPVCNSGLSLQIAPKAVSLSLPLSLSLSLSPSLSYAADMKAQQHMPGSGRYGACSARLQPTPPLSLSLSLRRSLSPFHTHTPRTSPLSACRCRVAECRLWVGRAPLPPPSPPPPRAAAGGRD